MLRKRTKVVMQIVLEKKCGPLRVSRIVPVALVGMQIVLEKKCGQVDIPVI